MSREDLKSYLGDKPLEELIFQNVVKWAFRRSQIFNKCPLFDQSRLVSLGEFVFKEDNEVICQVGEEQDKLYICLEGKINDFDKGAIIHEAQALEDVVEAFPAKSKLVKRSSGYIFAIHLKYVNKEKIREKKKNIDTLKHLQSKRELVTSTLSSKGCLKIDLKDLYVICKLGEGQMGKVYLVQDNKTEIKYALKCVEKNTVVKNEM